MRELAARLCYAPSCLPAGRPFAFYTSLGVQVAIGGRFAYASQNEATQAASDIHACVVTPSGAVKTWGDTLNVRAMEYRGVQSTVTL